MRVREGNVGLREEVRDRGLRKKERGSERNRAPRKDR